MNRLFMRGASVVLTLAVAGCDGAEGPAGPPGDDGIVNVSSGTFTVAPTAFTNGFWHFPVAGGTQANPAKVATVAVPSITSAMLTSGAVFVYLRTPSTPTGPLDHWTLLPFHQGGFNGGYLVSIKAAVRAGEIRIGYAHETTGAVAAPDVYSIALPTFEFRWVAIEGTAALGTLTIPDDPDLLVERLRRVGQD